MEDQRTDAGRRKEGEKKEVMSSQEISMKQEVSGKSRSRLSPWPYLRNNRVRSTVLVISLAMFMVMIYVMNYIVGGTTEPFEKCDVAAFERMRILDTVIFEGDEEFESDEAFLDEAWRRIGEVAKEMETEDEVIRALPFAWQATTLNSFIGQMGVNCYLFQNSKDCEDFLTHMEAKLISGRMPEAPGEVLMEKRLMDNHKNDNTLLRNMGSEYHVVGVISSDYYLSFGISIPGENDVNMMVLTPKGSDTDFRKVAEKHGFEVEYYVDREIAHKNLIKGMGGSLDTVQSIFTGVAGALLMICVSVVMALHIMDRHNEWCLLNSIGFGTGEIYLMALKEILICILIALVFGGILSLSGCFLLEKLLYNPIGITIRMFRPDAIPRILIVFAALLGISQIPLFNGMRKIQTIDAIE
ncbi:MAG: ABC transporter permease [Clostridiales bacterium]|nr:ABC transporter permease [Clostridiales bacterium]